MSHSHWGPPTKAGVFKYKTGLLLGGAIGLFSGGWFGLLFGAAVGYFLERLLRRAQVVAPQQLFFRATFCAMGKVAKADGRVTEHEIAFAREVMTRMHLSEAARRRAIEYFTEGKQTDFELEKVLRPLALLLRRQPSVKLMFLEVQLQIALADGQLTQAELTVLEQICHHLRFSAVEMQALAERIQAAQAFASHQQQPSYSTEQLLQEAYAVLGVRADATDGEIKKAWRRLMSQHHPDKLLARGLPEEMVELAKEKTQEIQAAYERIRRARGMR